MTPEAVLAQPPIRLTRAQREHYFREGYLLVEDAVPPATVAALREVTAGFVADSGRETRSGPVFDIGPGHRPGRPVLRRLKKPDERSPVYWDFARGLVADIAADLLGRDLVFHHSKLNFKWQAASAASAGSSGKTDPDRPDPVAPDQVDWHQDIQFFPHTNYAVLTIGCYLEDTDMSNGPLAVLPGSHEGPLYDLYDQAGRWTGHLRPEDAAGVPMEKAVYLTGRAGSLTVHNCRTLHFSPPSTNPTPRPLLLNVYAAADARAYTPHPDPTVHAYELIRGAPARIAHHDPRPCPIPPDWSGGYTSIFAAQQGEDAA
ncbi:MAG: phytanoyl-CoA dioxygenase family protein [Azospirillaceae bacterium]